MEKKRNVRLIDIAREVGVTVNTVSRALRDKEDIGYETKQTIKQVASNLGYIPNSIATSLRSGFSYTVAIVFDNMVNPYFMIMADKIHQQLDAVGYATMIFAVYDYMFKQEFLGSIISRKVDGIITFLEPTKEVVATCKKNDIPIVLIGRKNTQLDIDMISTDDYSGGFMVGEQFVKKGVKNVGYLGAPKAIECSVRRQNGLRDAFLKHNLSFNEKNMRYMENNDFSKDLEIMIKNNVDGILFFNDVMALEGIKYLKERGYDVPGDIKVAGYDDIGEDFPISGELTTVASNKNLIVEKAVEILYKKMKNKMEYSSKKILDIDVQLKIGSTC